MIIYRILDEPRYNLKFKEQKYLPDTLTRQLSGKLIKEFK